MRPQPTFCRRRTTKSLHLTNTNRLPKSPIQSPNTTYYQPTTSRISKSPTNCRPLASHIAEFGHRTGDFYYRLQLLPILADFSKSQQIFSLSFSPFMPTFHYQFHHPTIPSRTEITDVSPYYMPTSLPITPLTTALTGDSQNFSREEMIGCTYLCTR
jgi:hypothetical protein